MAARFVSTEEVLALHAQQLRLFSGASGVRDLGLLESAVGSAAATFGGAFLNETPFEMAAAYLYGICRNHPSSTATSGRRLPRRWCFSS